VSKRNGSARLVLAVLLLAYILNYLDRLMLGILAQPIKADLGLTDSRFGDIAGLAFAVVYSVLALPFALLADKTSRSRVVMAALVTWSAFTALCATASGFWQLFLFRLGVGVGEAGGVAPSYALISDYFPPDRRARALAIFALGIPIGGAGGMFIGAYIAAAIDWRAAFLVMGLAGILLAPFFLLFVRDRPRASARAHAPLATVFPILARKPAFWLLSLAAAMSSLSGYGLNVWMPSVLMRSFGLDIRATANFLGSAFLIGGCACIYAGGWLADRLGGGDRGWYAKLPAIAWLITAPLFVAGLLAPNLWVAWAPLMIASGLCILWQAPLTAAIQHLVPRDMRSTAAASYLLINNLIGLGAGPSLIGHLSDALKASHGADALRYAAVACTAFYLVAALLAFFAVRPLSHSWVDDSSD
jgi:predicted MFS family arabinose efflux permease